MQIVEQHPGRRCRAYAAGVLGDLSQVNVYDRKVLRDPPWTVTVFTGLKAKALLATGGERPPALVSPGSGFARLPAG